MISRKMFAQKGFTLLESIIVLGLLVMVLLPLTTSLIKNYQYLGKIDEYNSSYFILQKEAESLKQEFYDDILVGETLTSNYDGTGYDLHIEVEQIAGKNELKKITLTAQKENEKTGQLQFLLYKGGI